MKKKVKEQKEEEVELIHEEELREDYLDYLQRIVEGDADNGVEALNTIQPFKVWKLLR